MTRQVLVEITGDAKKLGKATKEAESFANRIKKAWSAPELKKGFLGGLGIGAGFGAANVISRGIGMVTDTIGDAIDAASDWGEATSKVSVVFEDQAGVIQRWARSASTSMGMSEREALKAAGTFGNLFDGLGIAEDAAVDMSQKVVQLAADLGSFNNVATDEALQALQSGLLGEAEPMRRFGVALSEAKVQAFGMAHGLGEMVRSGKTYKFVMSDANKVQARWGIILENTKNAQGDFARTSDGLANSQKTLNAEVDDLRVEIGNLMRGPAKSFVRFLSDVVTGIDNIKHALGDRGKEIDTETEAVILLGRQYGLTARQATELAERARAIAFPEGMTDAEKAAMRLDAIRDSFRQVANGARVAGRGIREDFGGTIGRIQKASTAVDDFVKAWDKGAAAFQNTADLKAWSGFLTESIPFINAHFAELPEHIQKLAAGMGLVSKETMALAPAVRIVGAFRDAFAGMFDGVKGPDIWVKQTVDRMQGTLRDALDPYRNAWQQLAEWAKDPFRPRVFADKIKWYHDEAIRRAKKAADEGKPKVAARWRAVAKAMSNPIAIAALNIGLSVEQAMAAIAGVKRAAKVLSTVKGILTLGWGKPNGKKAAGGPVSAGGTYLVGERGPEMLRMGSQSGHITPNHALGGATYNVVVNVAPGGDLVEAGRQMVRAIQQYQRNGGAAHVKRAVSG